MNCLQCDTEIENGETYLDWAGSVYCGTQCLVDYIQHYDTLEEKVREDYRNDTGTHFPNV